MDFPKQEVAEGILSITCMYKWAGESNPVPYPPFPRLKLPENCLREQTPHGEAEATSLSDAGLYAAVVGFAFCPATMAAYSLASVRFSAVASSRGGCSLQLFSGVPGAGGV